MTKHVPPHLGGIELKGEGDPPADDAGDLVTKALADLTKTVDDRLKGLEAKSATADKLAERLDKIELKLNRPGTGDPETDKTPALETKAFEAFLRTGREAMGDVERKALRLADDEQAGYLAPPEFVAEIDKNLTLFSPVRQVATVRQTARSEVTMLRRTSPATATWVSEDEDRSEAEVKYGAQSYPVCELATYIDVSLQMLEDAAVDVAAELAAELAEAFGAAEGTAFVTGNGAKRPMGFMSDTSLSYTPGGDASVLKPDGLIDLYHAVKPAYRINGVWMMNSATLAAARKLKDASGQYLLQTAPGFAQTPAPSILGRPVIEAPDMPDISGGAFPVVFGDFAVGYRIFDRISLSIVRDDFTQRTKGRVRFHARRRVAGGVRRAEAIRKLKISTT
ncbi:MAG: phage major capsid protein [Methylacidiphilales bacterium]|nr:phage major capsid protein [Candidatus Methylacidiphilales bacterium]